MSAAEAGALRSIVLVGLRGSGKSTVARALAARLGWRAIDTDEEIESRTGRSVSALFAERGEAAFRALEADAVRTALAAPGPLVLSVGGGAILAEESRTRIRAAGACVWLTAPLDELQRRLEADGRSAALRPPLSGLPPRDELAALSRERAPLYTAAAHHVVDTAGRSIEQVVSAILAVVLPRSSPE